MDPSVSGFIQELQAETEKVKLIEQVHTLTERCWNICFQDNRFPSKMDAKNERCLSNCVNRFIDASVLILGHLQGHNSGSHVQKEPETKKSSWW
uniref:Mitochondrial import inner membrane translocase subunit n=1 Tax=Strongyloides papillosus TaxID=174720 RepID=A0A0N5BSQ7_STREA